MGEADDAAHALEELKSLVSDLQSKLEGGTKKGEFGDLGDKINEVVGRAVLAASW